MGKELNEAKQIKPLAWGLAHGRDSIPVSIIIVTLENLPSLEKQKENKYGLSTDNCD